MDANAFIERGCSVIAQAAARGERVRAGEESELGERVIEIERERE